MAKRVYISGGAFDPSSSSGPGQIEDRQNEGMVSWGSGRMLDPTPLSKAAVPSTLGPGEYWANDLPEVPSSPLGKQLGLDDIERSHQLDILRLLGFGKGN